MSITRLQHIGTAVEDFGRTNKALEAAGLPTRDFRNDQGKGFQHDARVLLGNDCWLHIVHNWNPDARVNQFLSRRGEGLEHLALESDDIEADVQRLRDHDVPIYDDHIFDANDGYEAFVYPDDAIGFTIELIQPHVKSWAYPEQERGRALSDALGHVRATRVGARVPDVTAAASRFLTLFGLAADEPERIPLGNTELALVGDSNNAPGLHYLAIETERNPSGIVEHDFGFSILLERAGDEA